jgi:hypothetical protein
VGQERLAPVLTALAAVALAGGLEAGTRAHGPIAVLLLVEAVAFGWLRTRHG